MKSVKLALFLALVGALSGLSISYVNTLTAPKIEAAKAEKMNNMFNEYYGNDASTYEDVTSQYEDQIKNSIVSRVFEAKNSNDEVVGTILQSNPKGFGGEIEMLVMFNDSNDTIKGVSYLSMKETAGYGTKWKTEKDRKNYFNDMPIDQVKVDYITGATISSKAIEAGVKAAVEQYKMIK